MKIRFCTLLFLLFSITTTAWAGPFTDEMAKCLVRSTSEADKTLLIKWIFAAMSGHPDVKALSNVTPEKGTQLNQEVAAMVVRLITKSCKNETNQAVKFEGEDTFKSSFEVLGRVAMQGLMSNPGVAAYFNDFAGQLDADALRGALHPSAPTQKK